MRKFAAVFLVACLLPALYAQKTRFSQEPPKPKSSVDYPLKVHISGVHMRPFGNTEFAYADALVNGKKIDLRCSYMALPLGDYQARLKKNKLSSDPTELDQRYVLLLSDGSTLQCRVAGYSE